MSINASTLRPGLLVSLSTSLRGGISYRKEVIESEHVVEGTEATKRAAWQTERVITDAREHEAAKTARSKASALVRGVCAQSAFGLLCPETDKDKLDEALRKAREIVDAFNAQAALTRVSLYVLVGRVAPDDVEAIKAINSEIKDLMDAMSRGVENLDVKAIREAASKAKDVGAMLAPDAQARVQIAVEAARDAAKKIVKAGETAAAEVDRSVIRKIAECRTAFLDLDDEGKIVAPGAAGRALDLTPSAPLRDFTEPQRPGVEIDLG